MMDNFIQKIIEMFNHLVFNNLCYNSLDKTLENLTGKSEN